jgi:exportin-2 (importin alpha re-exporter)
VKTGICEIIELYTQRYEEEFQQLPTFFNTVLHLLMNVNQEPKYDVVGYLALQNIAFVSSAYALMYMRN